MASPAFVQHKILLCLQLPRAEEIPPSDKQNQKHARILSISSTKIGRCLLARTPGLTPRSARGSGVRTAFVPSLCLLPRPSRGEIPRTRAVYSSSLIKAHSSSRGGSPSSLESSAAGFGVVFALAPVLGEGLSEKSSECKRILKEFGS